MSSSILIDAFMLLLYYLRDNSLNTVPARRVAASDGAGSAAAPATQPPQAVVCHVINSKIRTFGDL